jgi:hypothetical protein
MTLDERNDYLRGLSMADFKDLGSGDVVYVRETEYMGKTHYAVINADGQTLSLATSMDNAENAILNSDFESVSLH